MPETLTLPASPVDQYRLTLDECGRSLNGQIGRSKGGGGEGSDGNGGFGEHIDFVR